MLSGCATPRGGEAAHGRASPLNPRQRGPLDLRQPSPLNLRVDCANSAVVGLRWDPAPRPSLLKFWQRRHPAVYQLSRDGVAIATTTETTYSDSSVAGATSYRYSLERIDASGETTTEAVSAAIPPQGPTADPPYCNSHVLSLEDVDWADGYHESNGSDLWHVTWGADGDAYAFFGDGGGIGGDNSRGRTSFGIAALPAPPPRTATTAYNLYGGFEARHPALIDGKAGSLIAVGSDFYVLGGIYTRSDLDAVCGDCTGAPKTHRSGSPSRLQLAVSRRNAYSWRAEDWSFCRGDLPLSDPAAGALCPSSFVNYGRGNSGAPGGYVYILGGFNSASYWTNQPNTGPARTYLVRVSPTRMLEREAYEYFAGLDTRGKPTWSHDLKRLQPIFTDANPTRSGCGGVCDMTSVLSQVVYDAPLKRYIGVAQGGSLAQSSFYEAPELWGPWSVISYNNIDPSSGAGGWGNLGLAAGESLGVNIVNAWTSPDGLALWLAYSSNGKAPPGALFPPAGSALDSLNLVRMRLRHAPD